MTRHRRAVGREEFGSRFWLGVGCFALLGVGGCGGGGPDPAPRSNAGPSWKGVKIVVAAVDDPAVLPTVAAQHGEWEASRGASCVVAGKAVTPADLGDSHVLIFRGDRLGDLMDVGALAVLPERLLQTRTSDDPDAVTDPDATGAPTDRSEGDALQFNDVIPAFRNQVSKYGADRVALPYGGSALVLVANRAAFERAGNREAAKAAGLTPETPRTWGELDALAAFFQGRDWNGDGSKDFGIALALGPDPEGVGDAAYLARAAALGQHKDHYSLLFDSDSMEPRLTTPPFVEALSGLAALKASGPPGAEAFDAAAARAAFRKGNVAFLIDRAERAGDWGGGGAKAVVVWPLPGSERVYEPARKAWETSPAPNRPAYLPHGGGWLVGVRAGVRGHEQAAAVDFVKYLVSPDTANRVRSDREFPMLPVRGSQVAQGITDPKAAPGVEPRSWSDAVGKTLLAPRVVPGLRIPGADGYLADLAKGRAAASAGTPAADALKAVSGAWSARTKSLGVERQLWHYRRTLNSITTAPEPPARPGGGG